MKSSLARLILMAFFVAGSNVLAQTSTILKADDLVAQFTKDSPLIRSAKAARFCVQSLQAWPQTSYENDMRRLGQLWLTQPEAAYFILDACQTLWSGRYFDPMRLKATGKVNDPKSWIGPVMNVLRSASHLREEIHAFSYLAGTDGGRVPPAPFEILSGMASSRRQLDEVLHQEMRESVQTLTTVGGAVGSILVGTKDFTALVEAGSVSVGRVYKYALVAAIVATSATKAVDYSLWRMRYSDLLGQVTTLQTKIGERCIPQPLVLDEYYNAVRQLGYFLNFDLYLKETQMESSTPTTPRACTKALISYYRDRRSNPNVAIGNYTNSQDCADAAVVWIEASDYLAKNFSKSPEAQLVASRLREKAQLTYLSYEATWAYIATLPVCRVTERSLSRSNIFNIEEDCFDPATGGQVI